MCYIGYTTFWGVGCICVTQDKTSVGVRCICVIQDIQLPEEYVVCMCVTWVTGLADGVGCMCDIQNIWLSEE